MFEFLSFLAWHLTEEIGRIGLRECTYVKVVRPHGWDDDAEGCLVMRRRGGGLAHTWIRRRQATWETARGTEPLVLDGVECYEWISEDGIHWHCEWMKPSVAV